MADLSRGGDWFAVLPDCAAASAAAQSFTGGAVQLVAHPSGRPWLVGRWPGPALTRSSDHRGTQTALLGCAAGPAPDAAGSFHVVTATGGGQVTVRGTASGVRRVFHARIGGVTVAADQARVLASTTGAGPDPAAVAGLLLAPSVPHPLGEDSLWQGVTAVPPDHRLTVGPDGTARTDRWWHPPEPDGPLVAGGDRLRAALRAAVAVRLPAGGGPVSADLSGGTDSTALCFLAAELGADLVTVRVAPLDPASDDPLWAGRAADWLPGEHLLVDPAAGFAELPGPAGPDDAEEPVGGLLTRALLGHTARLVAGRGSRRHLAGYGGDEVTGVSRAYLRDLLWRRPGLVLRHLPAHRSLRHWSLPAVLLALADQRSYRGWLAGTASRLRAAGPLEDRPQFGWGGATQLPAWATPLAADLLVDRLARAAAAAEPLARDRAQHRAVTAVWSAGHAARQLGRAMPGVELATPYLDDQVVAAALAVDLAERGTPWRYKPLLTEAMRPVLPEQLRERRTKGKFTADGIAGLRRHRAWLVGLCEDLQLARLGLVDPAPLRAACVGLDPTGRVLMAVENTISAELWLRAAAAVGGPVEAA